MASRATSSGRVVRWTWPAKSSLSGRQGRERKVVRVGICGKISAVLHGAKAAADPRVPPLEPRPRYRIGTAPPGRRVRWLAIRSGSRPGTGSGAASPPRRPARPAAPGCCRVARVRVPGCRRPDRPDTGSRRAPGQSEPFRPTGGSRPASTRMTSPSPCSPRSRERFVCWPGAAERCGRDLRSANRLLLELKRHDERSVRPTLTGMTAFSGVALPFLGGHYGWRAPARTGRSRPGRSSR